MEKKNNNGMLVGILIGLVIAIIVVGGLFATGIIKLNNNMNFTDKKENIKEENLTTDNKVENTKIDEEKYSTIIEEYKTAMNDKEYDANNEKYKYIHTLMMHYYHNNYDIEFKYTYYDINKDSKKELILGNGYNIFGIYTYDSEIKELPDQDCLGDRCNAELYDNGIIYFYGSNSAVMHHVEFYEIVTNGYSFNRIKNYTVKYNDNNATITDEITKTITDYKSDEEIILNVVGNANKIDLSKLNWTEIK